MAQNQQKTARVKVSPAEYLERERRAKFKSEYDNGVIIPLHRGTKMLADGTVVAMAGANKEHITVNVNLTIELGSQLKGSSCRVYDSDMRTRVPNTSTYRYPDLSVACDAEFESDVLDVLLNPVVLFEIASPSTEALDRSRKWNQYRTMPSLQDYVLISPTQVMVEQRHRADDGEHWWIRVLESLEDELVLDSVGCRVRLADIYDGIPLETDELETDEMEITSTESDIL